ncbi:MAG: aminoglycoside phosphotransferase family protein [Phycisphaerales bacterium]
MGAARDEIPIATRTVVEARLGAVTEVRRAPSANHGAAVWLARVGETRRVVLKQHPGASRFENERRAYETWTPALDGATPELVAAFGSPLRVLVLSECPGAPLSSCDDLSPSERCELYFEAGRILRRLHSLPVDDPDPVPLHEALVQRFEAWLRRSAEYLDPLTRRTLSARFGSMDDFAFARRSPCHRDFTPANWIADRSAASGRRLRVIDFEHARLDWALVDFVKLESERWSEQRNLREAFLDGYGRRLDDAEEEALDRLVVLHGLATMVWGAEHSDTDFERRGRRILASVGVDL